MDRPSERGMAIAILISVLVILTGKLLYAKLAYDDWACAFAHCTKVK